MKNSLETFPKRDKNRGGFQYIEKVEKWLEDFEEELNTPCNPVDCEIYPPYNLHHCKNWCKHKLTPMEILGK